MDLIDNTNEIESIINKVKEAFGEKMGEIVSNIVNDLKNKGFVNFSLDEKGNVIARDNHEHTTDTHQRIQMKNTVTISVDLNHNRVIRNSVGFTTSNPADVMGMNKNPTLDTHFDVSFYDENGIVQERRIYNDSYEQTKGAVFLEVYNPHLEINPTPPISGWNFIPNNGEQYTFIRKQKTPSAAIMIHDTEITNYAPKKQEVSIVDIASHNQPTEIIPFKGGNVRKYFDLKGGISGELVSHNEKPIAEINAEIERDNEAFLENVRNNFPEYYEALAKEKAQGRKL